MLLVLLVFNTRIVTRQVILIKFQCNICSDLTVSSSCSSFFCPLAFQKERASKVEKAEENEGFENLDAIGIGGKEYYKKSFFNHFSSAYQQRDVRRAWGCLIVPSRLSQAVAANPLLFTANQ